VRVGGIDSPDAACHNNKTITETGISVPMGSMPMDEKGGRTAIVTGGSRGIGQAIVEELARSGWKVGFTYNANGEAANRIVSSLKAEGCSVAAFQADVRDFQRAGEVVKSVEESLGPVALLVNNAGVKKDSALLRMDPAKWQEVIDTNLGGTFNYSRNVVMGMVKRGQGSIINIVSVSGILGLSGQTNYSASKAGVIGFTRALAKEVARFSIRVNAVAPGFIETDMITDIPENARKTMFAQIPMGSPGSPAQVAKVVAFLAGDGAGYITGQVLPVDGGMV
jgi:3-oxoacyl-[acyl-carrier protein] reductase